MATVSDLKDALRELSEKYPYYLVGESPGKSEDTVRSWVVNVKSDGCEVLLKLSDEGTQDRSKAISVENLYQSIMSLSSEGDAPVELCLCTSENLRLDSGVVGARVVHDQKALVFLSLGQSDNVGKEHTLRTQVLRAVPFYVFVLVYILYRVLFSPYNAAEGSRYAEPGQKIIVQKVGYEINVGDLVLHKSSEGTTVAEVVTREGSSSEMKLGVKRPDTPTVELDNAQLVGKVVWITDKSIYLILVLVPFGVVTVLYFQPIRRMKAWQH